MEHKLIDKKYKGFMIIYSIAFAEREYLINSNDFDLLCLHRL